MPKFNVNGTEIYYETAGQGQPVLFIHGLGSSARDWEPQVKHFTTKYQVITFDVRGHGQSDKPQGPYTIPLFAADTITLIKMLGLGPVHLVGISMGGMIAFQLAVDAPELVRSMTIVNSGPALIVRTLAERLSIWQRFIIVRLLGMRKMGEVLAKRLFPKDEHAAIRATFADRWAENDQRAYLDAMRALVNWSVAEHLPKITCPTLFLCADQDYSPTSLKEFYAKQMPHAELVVIADAHHAVPVEQPEEFNRAVDEFLAKQK